MPIYLFENPDTDEVIEVIQRMSDVHEHTDENGLKWGRVWTSPTASTDSHIDPWNKNQFLEKTKTTGKATMGDIWDRSQELSQKRAEKNGGIDPVRKKYESRYAEGRKGKRKRGR